jgi:hypothetical protein
MSIVIARMILAGNIITCMGEKTSAYIVLVRKSDGNGKRPIGRPKHR